MNKRNCRICTKLFTPKIWNQETCSKVCQVRLRKGYVRPYVYPQQKTGEWRQLSNPMKLMTKEIYKSLPPLYSQEKVKDPMIKVKFFYGGSTWGAYEGSEVCPVHSNFDCKECPKPWHDYLFFGWATHGDGGELGYFSLKELASFRGRFGLGIERDMYFDPTPLSKFKQQYPNPIRNREKGYHYPPSMFGPLPQKCRVCGLKTLGTDLCNHCNAHTEGDVKGFGCKYLGNDIWDCGWVDNKANPKRK
jgi:hypothetical protein